MAPLKFAVKNLPVLREPAFQPNQRFVVTELGESQSHNRALLPQTDRQR